MTMHGNPDAVHASELEASLISLKNNLSKVDACIRELERTLEESCCGGMKRENRKPYDTPNTGGN